MAGLVFIPSSLSSWTSGLLLGNEFPAVLPLPGSTAASAVFIGAPPRNLFEPKRRARRSPRRPPRARARVLPETTEALTREVLKLGDVGISPPAAWWHSGGVRFVAQHFAQGRGPGRELGVRRIAAGQVEEVRGGAVGLAGGGAVAGAAEE